MRIVCMSDSHGRHGEILVPEGDVFVHAGDFSMRGQEKEVRAFGAFLRALPHRHKVVIAGNHDLAFESRPAEARAWLGEGCTYLECTGAIVGGLRFWGSPHTPRFFDWAFNVDRGPALARIWAGIPAETEVLVTHGPPHGLLDVVSRGGHEGCAELRAAVQRVRPKLHVFGHIHEAAGEIEDSGTRFVNACVLDERYRPARGCTVVELP